MGLSRGNEGTEMDENDNGQVDPAHKKQVLTYLRLTGLKRGDRLNVAEALMDEGWNHPSDSWRTLRQPLRAFVAL